MHVKATEESDHHKSFLIQVPNSEDTIATLKKIIGEKMESTYDMYKKLKNVYASKIMKKVYQNQNQPII